MSMAQNRWTSNLKGHLEKWTPPKGEMAGVEHYLCSAAFHIESACSGQGLHFHVTANMNSAPLRGPRSIMFVISEETGPPRYSGSVGAVFKCYGAKPSASEWSWSHPALVLSSLAKDAIVWKRTLVNRWRWRTYHIRQGRIVPTANVHHIPLGYYAVPPPDFPAWNLRVNDVFFAGSLRKKAGERKGILRLASPKEVVRSDLVQALKRFTEEKQWTVRLLLAPSFVPYALATEMGAEGSMMTPENYMKEMANSKICLAPRGTCLETFRHYEAASVGCVVVSGKLPLTWFYRNVPFVFVNDWRNVDQVLHRLLQDPANLKRLHEETLKWWNSRLSPTALADFVINVLHKQASVMPLPSA
jgi:hypothetical protein